MNNKNVFEKNAKIPDIVQQKANAAFATIYNRQDEPDEKPQKTNKSAKATIIKIASAVVAAAITIVVLFAALENIGGKGSDSPISKQFTIKVCAAELEPKASLPISLDVSNQAFGSGVDWTGLAEFQINFPISVEGENISSVTFKADNAVFEVVSIDCPSIVKSGSPKTLPDYKSTYVDGYDLSGHPIGMTEVEYYNSFSADYGTLQKSKYLLNVCNVLKDRMDLYYLLTHEGSDDDRCAAYTYLLKDVKLTIEVTFNDGTTSSRSLCLFAKRIMATDKMADGTEYTYNAIQIFCYDENDVEDATKQLISSQITRAAKICKAEAGNNTSGDATTTEATTEAETEETTTAPEESAAESKASHKVTVDIVKKMGYSDGANEFKSVYPRIFVDGKEATELNKTLYDYIQKNYAMEKNGEYYAGFSTRIAWGVKDNTLSIVIMASDMGTDYFTREAFNYDLDTLKAIDDKEVTKRLGMTDDELFTKAKELVNKYCSTDQNGYDLEKSLALINYDKLTPFVMPDGKPGVTCCIVYGSDGQFGGLEHMVTFNMTTMEVEHFR